MSFAQQRMWFVAQMFPGAPTYNEPIMVQMAGHVDVLVLARCLTEITRRHEAWRTVFTAVDGVPLQVVRPPGPFDLPVVDLTHVPIEQREPEVLRLARDDARRPFDLQQGPLVRALLLRLSDADTRLIVTAHHIVVDGVSFFSVFLPELHALYAAFSDGQPSPLPEPSLQYADFAVWQRRWLTEDELAPRLDYWRAHMAGFAELDVPADRPRPKELSGDGGRVPVTLRMELVQKLRELGHRAGVTLFTTLLAAWQTLLFRYTGQPDIVVGSAAAGRPLPELERLIGFFNKNLVLRTQLDGKMTFLELLPRAGEVLKGAREHQDVPFDRLVTELSVERSLNRNPIYSNVFLLMPPRSALEGPPEWTASRIDIGTAKVDVYLELHRRPQGLVGHIEYVTELFSAATIERMIGHLQTLLEGIVQNPEQRLEDLPILTPAEAEQLALWQGPAVAPLPDSEILSLEQLFEAQAARSPSAIAVEHGEERLTYDELNRRANQLAHFLRSQGVGAEILVGLCMKRSIDAVVGILGVLKAGGAYVPLDPDYPSERLRFMLQDADIKLLLTNETSASTVQYDGRTILLDKEWPSIAQHSDDNPAPVATAGNLGYVIYTSGSTGRPKGVLVERRGLYYLAKAQERAFGLGVGSRILQFFSINFDSSIWEFTMAWPVGATLVLVEHPSLLSGLSLTRLLKEMNIHAITLTPSALMATPLEELPALEILITAGEALPEELVNRWAPGRRFFNAYGPTEVTIDPTLAECRAGGGKPSIGRPFEHVAVYILDAAMHAVPVGIPGELYVGGPGVARGYLNRADLNTTAFVPSPFPETAGTRLYKTGDRVKWCPDGTIDYLGRTDSQVKLRGFRIELEEIEAELNRHPAVQAAAVKVFDAAGDQRLVGFVVPGAEAPGEIQSTLKQFLRTRLPEHMVPATIVPIDPMPIHSNGKIDRTRLHPPPSPESTALPVSTSSEALVAAVWREVLGLDVVSFDTPFFEIGGHSLALARVQAKLSEALGIELDIVTLLRLPTIRQLAAHVAAVRGIESDHVPTVQDEHAEASASSPRRPELIAIIGMSIRAPGVRSPEELWDVVREGRETLKTLEPEALIAAGADPARVHHPQFVPVAGIVQGADQFDAALFGYSDADATLMDPQQRLFLECAYEALEHAGCNPARFSGKIGVFGGSGAPIYLVGPVMQTVRAAGSNLETLRAYTLNMPDFLATRVAFKLGLHGPAVTVQTACSTSLSAVHIACRSLLANECDMALAGGATVHTLTEADQGYLYTEGGPESSDGHCRPFDAAATGTVRSNGVAIVVMKRLSDAVSHGDTIHAIVLGSAMNNDGAGKVGFTAPSEDGVAEVIQRAYEVSGVDPVSVQFVEAHGTGTRLGDPIEVRALTRAFRQWTERHGFCALGSLKANLGHIDTAAGAAGLMKAALALSREVIPPVANFRTGNPLLGLSDTPFFVPSTALPWPRTNSPRRAAVSSLGIGGTNVHVVLEEPPVMEASKTRRPYQLLCLSARTESALAAVVRRLGVHLAECPSIDIADVAHTLALGRTEHKYRATWICQDTLQAQGALARRDASAGPIATPVGDARPVVFLFPGHGVQYPRMALDIYESERIYRTEIDRCLEILAQDAHLDLAPLLFTDTAEARRRFDELQWAHSVLFTLEYALAKQWMAWGVRPVAMLGHSLGEYVAACIAGVFSLRDALLLVAARGRLADATPPGGMLVVFADERTIQPYLDPGASIATVAPGCVVLSGLADAIDAARKRLADAEIETKTIRASRAGHSPVMHTIREAFLEHLSKVELRPATIRIVSNVTGKYMTADQATSPHYWADHLCRPVRLGDGLGTLLGLDSPVCIELGPGNTLGSFLKGHSRYGSRTADVIGTLPDFRRRDESSHAGLLKGLGRAWELGVNVDWQVFYAYEKRRRIPLPTYPFEGRRFMVGAAQSETAAPLDARATVLARELGVRGIDDYPGLRPGLEELCAALVLDFFARRLGDDIGRARPVDALRSDAGIVPRFARMFDALVEILQRAGFASEVSPGQVLLSAAHAGRSAELCARLQNDFPMARGHIRFIQHCTNNYDEVLTGAADPTTVLFPDGTNNFFLECMREMGPPHWFLCNALAYELVLEIVARRSGKGTRILEIGAGQGMLTWPLVERLHGHDVEYHFTDIGNSLVLRARAEATRRGVPWMKAFRFDMNRPPEEQGVEGPYDIILGLDSVHVALDLSTTLGNLHSLLVPGGSLMFVELMRRESWYHLTDGLWPEYWNIQHARGSRWTDLDRWEELLHDAHFARVTTVPRDAAKRRVVDHGLVIAERALTAQPSERVRVMAARPDPVATSALPTSPPDPVAPMGAADDAEQLVVSLWKRLLGVSYVPPDRTFFELGGDSLLALQFLAELRVRTGQEIKLRQFSARPTVEGIATVLSSRAAETPVDVSSAPGRASVTVEAARANEKPGEAVSAAAETVAVPFEALQVQAADAVGALAGCLVPLQSAGMKRPFFCIHPIGGSVLCYEPLARAFGADRPFFGIQSPMIEDRNEAPNSIEDMAAHYLDAIRQVQPRGPYMIGGWSLGGVVAAEMARQIKQSGQTVAQLVLLDVSAMPSKGMELLRRVDERLPVLAMLAGIVTAHPGKVREEQGAARNESARFTDMLAAAAQNLAVYQHHLEIWRRHTTVQIDVPATHFVADDRSPFQSLIRAGSFRKLTFDGATMVPVPGNHLSMLSADHAGSLAMRMKDVLDAAEPEPADGADNARSLESDESSVRAFLARWMNERDAASLAAMYAVDSINVAPGESIVEGSKLMTEHYMRKMPTIHNVHIRAHRWRIRMLAGGRVACAVGQVDTDQTLVQTGRHIAYKGVRLTFVLERQGETWRFVHTHYSLPVGGPLDTVP